jgi:RecA-family ATPase
MSYDKDAYLAPNHAQLKPLDNKFLEEWLPKVAPVIALATPEFSITRNEQLKQLDIVVEKIVACKKDITGDHDQWLKIGFALCELGENGREYFQQISQFYPGYTKVESDEKFDELLETKDGRTSLGTLFYIAKQNGITYTKEITRQAKSQLIGQDEAGSCQLPLVTTERDKGPRKANHRIQDSANQPPIKRLVGSMWYSGELHILFGDNGTGKSVWALQIADALSSGTSTLPILPNDCEPQKVLFYDFELSDCQFAVRYKNESGEPYQFSERLYVDNIDFQSLHQNNKQRSSDDLIIAKIEDDIQQLNPEVLVIDNLSYLKTEATQDAGVALDLIKKLNELKRKYSLSILVLAHTPKIKPGMQLTNNDLAGSKQLSNLVDSISAIGKSTRSPEEIYIKQTKSRTGINQFNYDKVISCLIQKEGSFLQFTNHSCDHEKEHLRDINLEEKATEKTRKQEQALELHTTGLSLRDIQDELGIGKSTIQRWIKESGKE